MARQMLCVRNMALVLIPPSMILALLVGAGGSRAGAISMPVSELSFSSDESLGHSLMQDAALPSSEQVFATSSAAISSSQGDWFFGFFGELHFDTGVALPGDAALTNHTIFTSEASIAQSDASGNLLFYSDGRTIWNNLHATVNSGLNGGTHPVQALSVPDPADPNPGNPKSFYLISMRGYVPFPTTTDGNFGYTKVSVSGSNLTLSSVNTPINLPAGADNISEMVTAVPGCGNDFWIIVHGSHQDMNPGFSHALFVYPLTSAGIGAPVVYPIVGPALFGQLKASPDGTRIAYGTGDERSVVGSNPGYSRVLDFNRNTGVLSNPRVINRYGYGVSFSPNSQLLYLTDSVSSLQNIFQYDLSTADVNDSEILVAELTETYSALQLGPDNKIYVALNGNNHLAVINFPDERNSGSAPNACGYSFDGPFLNIPSNGRSVESGFGLPNMIDARKASPSTADCCPTIALFPAAGALPGAVVNTSYSQTFTATGGIGPYSFTLSSGTPPPGMVLNGAGTLSGNPVTPGMYNFTVTAADTNGCLGVGQYQIIVSCPVITLNPADGALPGAVVNTPYSQTLTATAGCTSSFTFSVTSGGLPTGITLSTNGVLSGTSTEPGDFTFTVTATDSCGCSQIKDYTLKAQSAANAVQSKILVISAFRENGPEGAEDEFVEIFNPSEAAVTVGTLPGNPGEDDVGVFSSAGKGTASDAITLRCLIPGTTVIKGRGWFLCGGSTYSLGNLGVNGGQLHSEPDVQILGDIPNDAGLVLLKFSTAPSVTVSSSMGFLSGGNPAMVFDSVGFGPYDNSAPASAEPLLSSKYCEGTCLRPVGDASTITPPPAGCPTTVDQAGAAFPVQSDGVVGSVPVQVPLCYGESGQYQIGRRRSVQQFNNGTGSLHRDTDNNADDFILLAPNPSSNIGQAITGSGGLTSVLGAAGPHSLQSPPILGQGIYTGAAFDLGNANQFGPGNAERRYNLDPTIVNPNNNPLGTFLLRIRFANNGNAAVSGVRFRIDDITGLCGGQTGAYGPGSLVGATSETATQEARNLRPGTPDPASCQGPDAGDPFTAVLKGVNYNGEFVSQPSDGTIFFVNGSSLEDVGVGAPGPTALSPLGGGGNNSYVINSNLSTSSIGDGVSGGQGSFAVSQPNAGSTSSSSRVLRVAFRFGVVKAGRLKLLIGREAFGPAPVN